MTVTPATIDLHQYEAGSIFSYETEETWCTDGQAVIIDTPFGERLLVDTYWSDREHVLSAEQAATAKVIFVPSQHREIGTNDVSRYRHRGDAVIEITRQAGCYKRFYVPADAPELTEADHYRAMIAEEQERLRNYELQAMNTRASIERFKEYLSRLEAEGKA